MLRPWAQPLALAAVGMLIGCGPIVRSTPFASFASRPPEHPIRVYSTQVPDCPYEEVGLVSAQKRDMFVSMDEVLDALKREAREMGGDAVVGVSESAVASGGSIGETVTIGSNPVLSGTVIRFTQTDCTS